MEMARVRWIHPLQLHPGTMHSCFLIRTMDSLSVLHQAAMWLQFQWEASSPLFPTRMLSPEFFCTETLTSPYLIAYLVKTIFRPLYHLSKRFPSSGIPTPRTATTTSKATKVNVSFLMKLSFLLLQEGSPGRFIELQNRALVNSQQAQVSINA